MLGRSRGWELDMFLPAKLRLTQIS